MMAVVSAQSGRGMQAREAVKMPRGTPQDLDNLDAWLAEFMRIGELRDATTWICAVV